MNSGSARFVRETTTSPDYACWVLYDGDRVVSSVLARANANEREAMTQLVAQARREGEILAQIDRLIADA